MAYKIKTLPLANFDLAGIEEYLLEVSKSKTRLFFETLKKQRQAIKQNPRMFREYEEFPPYRIMGILDYVVLYIVDDETQTIIIHRILWGGMDLPNRLKESSNPAKSSY